MNDKDNSPVYELIAKLCKEKGTSPTALCTEITGSKGNLRTWQKGSINPVSLTKIADYFNVSTDYILGRTDSPTEKHVVQNNVTGDNNNDVSISVNDTSYSEQQEQIGKVMAGLTPRQRVDLMKTIYQFADEHGIIIE